MATALLGIICWLGLSTDVPAFSPADFQKWFATACQGQLRLPREVARTATTFRYVFVRGFGSEYLSGYFIQNARELRTQGVPRQAIHFIEPRSSRTLEENLATVREEIRRIAALGPERLVVIAHSRGACDALAFALQNPHFVHDRIQALFLIQGPFGGTGLADYLVGQGEPIDGRMPLVHRWVAHQAGKVARKSMSRRGWEDAIAGLTRETSKDYWRRSLKEQAEAIPMIAPRVFFIEAQSPPSQRWLLHKVTGSYLQTYYGVNDGMVTLDDQRLPDVGTSLGPVDAEHNDLTCRFPTTTAGKRYRKALIQSILMAVGKLATVTATDQRDFTSVSQHSASIR
jgi:pimeloyl-ACP methyl ester carboxylesterase